jgi:hypothetical protein
MTKDELTTIREFVQTIEFSPLGIRALKALEPLRAMLKQAPGEFPLAVLPCPLRLEYADPTCLRVLHETQIDFNVDLKVVGNPENGTYEWLIQRENRLVHSNCGYGMSSIALRDGLNAYFADENLCMNTAESLKTARTVERITPGRNVWRYTLTKAAP